jgi:hypothetical protein
MGLLDFITGNNNKKTKQKQIPRQNVNYPQQQRQVQMPRQQQYAPMQQTVQPTVQQPVNFDPNDPALSGLLPNLTFPKSEPAPIPTQINNQVIQPELPQPIIPMQEQPLPELPPINQPQIDNKFNPVEPYEPIQVQPQEPVTSDPNSLMSEYEKADLNGETTAIQQNNNSEETIFGNNDLATLYPQQINQNPVNDFSQSLPVQQPIAENTQANPVQNVQLPEQAQPMDGGEVTSMSQMSQGTDLNVGNDQFDLSNFDLSKLNLDNLVTQEPTNISEPQIQPQEEPQTDNSSTSVAPTNQDPIANNEQSNIQPAMATPAVDVSKIDFDNLNFDLDKITNSLAGSTESSDSQVQNVSISPQSEITTGTSDQPIESNIPNEIPVVTDNTVENFESIQPDMLQDVQSSEPVVNAMVPAAESTELIPPVASATTYENMSTKPVKKIFKRIGMIGLNISGIDDQIERIANDLNMYNSELLIDTRDNSGEIVINALGENTSRITGVYLKPMLSASEDLTNENVIKSNIFSIVYSSYLEKLRHFVKESRLFIFFDDGSADTLSTLLTVWQISSMYKGNNKPILLYGLGWESKINAIKQLATDIDTTLIHIITDPAEVLNKIEELNTEYSNANLSMVERLIDRRVQGDEKDYVVY